MLSDRHIRIAAYFVGQEIVRRRRFGHPIPAALHDLAAALTSALSAPGQASGTTTPDPSRWKTTDQLATEWGCTSRTVRRSAAAAGGRKIHDRWVFEDQEQT
jgi:hypothetical protein